MTVDSKGASIRSCAFVDCEEWAYSDDGTNWECDRGDRFVLSAKTTIACADTDHEECSGRWWRMPGLFYPAEEGPCDCPCHGIRESGR